MRLIQKIIDSFKPKTTEKTLREWSSYRVDPYEWQPLNVRRGKSDFTPMSRKEMFDNAFDAWMNDPLAGHIVNLNTWFAMGEGITFSADDDRAQELIHEFWSDPESRWDLKQIQISDELQVFGEVFLRLFINPLSGKIKAALIDPREIVDIAFDSSGQPNKYLRAFTRRIYNDDPDSFTGTFEFETEDEEEEIASPEIMHIAVNRLSSGSRGVSELYRILPWLDLYSQWLRDRVALNRVRSSFAYLRKVPGSPAQAKEVFEKDPSTGRYKPPQAGSVLVVNEGEEWQVLHPSIGADDAQEDGRALKLMIASGSGIFEHYFGDPSTGNLATTRSMELPMLKKFEARQRLLGGFYRTLFKRVIETAKSAGRLPSDTSSKVEVEFPPIVKSEIKEITSTLIDQLDAGLISKRRALSLNPWVEDIESEIEKIENESNTSETGE